jgi:hypothetical protein
MFLAMPDTNVNFPLQATRTYGAEFALVKDPAHNFTLSLLLFLLKYDTTADDVSLYILAENKSTLELGKSAANGGNFTTDRGNSVPYLNKEKP